MKSFVKFLVILSFSIPSSAMAAGWKTVAKKPPLLGARPHCHSGSPVLASFYYTGRVTASAARFRPNGISVAHRSLPFGTHVTFINPSNGRSVNAVINDRGPWGRAAKIGVKFDLSLGAARSIGMNGSQWLCVN
jgi:rare lipoprotein A